MREAFSSNYCLAYDQLQAQVMDISLLQPRIDYFPDQTPFSYFYSEQIVILNIEFYLIEAGVWSRCRQTGFGIPTADLIYHTLSQHCAKILLRDFDQQFCSIQNHQAQD